MWAYSGLALETRTSADYRYLKGQLQRSRKQTSIRGLNKDHNHDLKGLSKAAATNASVRPGPFQEFYESSLAKGIKPTMVRLSLARKIAAIPLPFPTPARSQSRFRSGTRSVTAIMITTSNFSVKRSGTPNQFLGVLLHTMAMSGLSRVRTEPDPLPVVPFLTHHPDTGEPSVSVPSRPWRSSVHFASSGGDTCAPLRQTAHRDLRRLHQQETQH